MPPTWLPQFLFVSLLSLTIIASLFTHSYSQCLDDQKTLLVELKNEMIFDSSFSGKLVQWNQTEDCCNWPGVECDFAGHVISLQLDDEAISGGIGDSSSLFRFQYLEKLNLAYNEFNNTQIPRGIRNLNSLTHLNLSYADFGGQVPLELSSLRRLVSLDISHRHAPLGWRQPLFTRLFLEFPNLEMFLRNLTGLRELYLDNVDISSQKSKWSNIISSYLPNLRNLSLRLCGLSGPLDTSLLQLHTLSVLRLDGNNLSTAIPEFIANFSSLTILSLQHCYLEGTLPQLFFHIPTLQYLDLSRNQYLTGAIPPFPGTGSLKTIYLSNCNFTGFIPSTLANHTLLTHPDLSSNFFIGSLSTPLFSGLSNLVYLDLGHNSFTGNIPQLLFALPSLRYLSLQQNQFAGEVEGFPIVNVSNLYHLDLSSNQFEGPISYSLLQLQGLEYLSLSNNKFNGTFQLAKFRSLPNIQHLELSQNNLSVDTSNVNSSSQYPQLRTLTLASCNLPDFPDFIRHLDVMVLDLSNNRIAGEIPNWFWGVGTQLYYVNLSSNLLTGLQKPFIISPLLNELDLSSNQLQGELYMPISERHVFILGSNFTSYLFFLSLANNNLSGSIPNSLCNATQLGVLDLSHNELSGSIPPCLLQNIENLEVFNVGGNNISGQIPDSFSPNCSLLSFDANNNALEGRFPKSLESCKLMEFMNVGNNILNDSFPCMLPSSLRVLVLHSNRFQGEVICRKSWPNLQILDISSNNFSGSLESINFSSWKALGSDGQLRYNRSGSNYLKVSSFDYRNVVTITIKGMQLELAKIWPDFTAIDFSSNNFHGEIPDAIGNLVSLYLLNLSHNGLTGPIPNSFGKLTQLGSLDLSTNQLTGKIPQELARLTFLSVLNLSYNKLVGKIPNGPQFQTFSADSFRGNSELCDFPLNISCHSTDDFDTSPPDHQNVEPKREIEWEYVYAAAGYVVGLGSIVWLLVFCTSFREKYFQKIEEVVEERFSGGNRRRKHARRVLKNQGRRH